MSIGRGLCCAALLGTISALPAAALANINLELRHSTTAVLVGDTIEVGLYVVSDDGADQPFGGFQVMLGWDADAFMLTDVVEGDISWLVFRQDDCAFDGLNNELCPPLPGCISSGDFPPCNDGDARLDTFSLVDVIATPEGVLGAKFVFDVIAPAGSASIRIIPMAGPLSETRVLANDPQNPIITGTLGELTLSVAACGTHGDFDGDCRIDLPFDYASFAACMDGPDGAPILPACDPADFNGDGVVDMRDAAAFQRAYAGE